MAQGHAASLQLAVQIVGLAVLVWVAIAIADGPRQSPPGMTGSSAILDELADIRARLRSLEEQRSRPIPMPRPAVPAAPREAEAPADPERVPIDPAATGVAAEIAALRRDINAIAARWSTSQQGMQSAARWKTTDWRSLGVFRDAYRKDEKAEQELLFLSTPSVVSRFGRPNRVFVDQSGTLHWTYERQVEGMDQEVTIAFRDGFVIGANAN